MFVLVPSRAANQIASTTTTKRPRIVNDSVKGRVLKRQKINMYIIFGILCVILIKIHFRSNPLIDEEENLAASIDTIGLALEDIPILMDELDYDSATDSSDDDEEEEYNQSSSESGNVSDYGENSNIKFSLTKRKSNVPCL